MTQTTILDSKPLPARFLKRPEGLSVEQARANMLAAKEPVTTRKGGTRVPNYIQKADGRGQGGNTPVTTPQATVEILNDAEEVLNTPAQSSDVTPNVPTPVRQEAAPVIPAAPQPAVVDEQETPAPAQREPVVQRVENDRFVAEFYKDGKDWVAEVRYKDGAGTERFAANSKDALILKLCEGKGHATLRVRESVRREKTATVPDSWNDFWNGLYKENKLTQSDFDKMPLPAKEKIIDIYQSGHVQGFRQDFPEFQGVEADQVATREWLTKNNIPLTRKNLGIAFRDLTADKKLTIAAPAPTQTTSAAPNVPPTVVGTPSAVPAAPIASVRKRGQYSSGLVPGQSSASGMERQPAKSDGPTEAEARKMPLKDLRRVAGIGVRS